jgi:hypothetical protein
VTGSARALVFDSELPLSMWAEAVSHAVYTTNHMPHMRLGGRSPDEVVKGEVPNLGLLQPFASATDMFLPEARR